MWLEVVLVVGLLAAWAYVRWLRVRRHWAERGVPHDPPHLLLGSLTFLQNENPAPFMRRLYDRFRAPYVGIWLFWRPALVINSPQIARRVLIKDADIFRNRLLGTGIGKTDPIGGLNLFTVNDPIWSTMRRNLSPVFTSAKLRVLNQLKLTKSKELVQRITNELNQKKEIELRNVYTDYSTDVIGASAFGVSCDATLTGTSPMRAVTKDFMEYDFYRGLGWISIFFIPEIVNFCRFTLFPKSTTAYFRKVYHTIVAQKGDYKPGSQQRDLLDTLIKIKHDAIQNNEEMSDDLIIAQAAAFLQGGFDTTAVALAFLTYELAFHPEIQKKLYQELVDTKAKLGDEEFDTDILSELPYLNAVIKEVLRKYPPMGWLDRISEKPYQIDEKLTIPAGTPVYINAVGMHYDPEFYPEPDKFIPERFLNDNKSETLFTYMPFGEGPRHCIGKRFAYHTLWYAIPAVFMKYQVRPKPGAKTPSQIKLEKRAMFLMPGEELYVDFILRN